MQERTNSFDEAGRQASPSRPLASWYAQGLSDGLGDRLLMFDNSGAPSLELLRFRRELAEIPGFETALREQVHRLGRFDHPAFARARSVQRLEPDDDLALVSNCPPGKRLSEVLHHARGPAFAAALIRQLAPALVLFQQHDPGLAHGLLNPDRIVVTPEGRLTIVEHVVGPAIDRLGLRSDQLASMGVALPPAPGRGATRRGVDTDWYQLGLVAVAVLLGRPVTASDLPHLDALLDGVACAARVDGSELSPFMRQWLDRALQISGGRIESGLDARAALEELLEQESPRNSRRVESLRLEQPAPPSPQPTAPPAPPPAISTDAFDDMADEPVEDHRTVSGPTAHPADVHQPAPKPLDFIPRNPAPPRPPAQDTAHFEARAWAEAPARPALTRTLFEQEALAGKKRFLDMEARAALHVPPAATRQDPPAIRRRGVAIPAVAALALIAVGEAGVIAWLAHARWMTPQPAVIVETAASGDNVVVSGRSKPPAPLQLTVAPDLRWVRVASPSAAGVLGGRITGTDAGAIRISSPIPLKVFEGSRLLGSVPGADLQIPAGRHEIEFVNGALGYRLRQTLEVEAGQTVSVHVAPPHGWVTIDASPWAEVSIDGREVGRTPLGPLPLALGEHQITFRHPAGSKDRQRVTIKSEETLRVVGVLRF